MSVPNPYRGTRLVSHVALVSARMEGTETTLLSLLSCSEFFFLFPLSPPSVALRMRCFLTAVECATEYIHHIPTRPLPTAGLRAYLPFPRPWLGQGGDDQNS